MKQAPHQEDARRANGSTPAQGSARALFHPSNLKPWEDRDVAPEDRLRAYKECVREKVGEILAAVDRLGDDASKTL